MKDWRFDVGRNERGYMTVAPWVSTLPDRRFLGLTRQELLELKAAIDRALNLYPEPRQIGEKG